MKLAQRKALLERALMQSSRKSRHGPERVRSFAESTLVWTHLPLPTSTRKRSSIRLSLLGLVHSKASQQTIKIQLEDMRLRYIQMVHSLRRVLLLLMFLLEQKSALSLEECNITCQCLLKWATQR